MEERDLLLKYNLQWFAKEGPGGEKTEPATAKIKRCKRRRKSCKKQGIFRSSRFNCFIPGIEDFWKLCLRKLNE